MTGLTKRFPAEIRKMKVKEAFLVFLSGEGFLCAVNFLCYMDPVWMLPLQVFMIAYFREAGRLLHRFRQKRYREDFRALLQSLITSLQAGYSLENALGAARKEMTAAGLQGRISLMGKIEAMNRRRKRHVPLRQLFADLARETDLEEIYEFAMIIDVVYRTGGNMVETIRDLTEHLKEKMDTGREIEVLMSGRVFEKNIMLTMPFLILLYLRLSDPGYTECFYKSLSGHIIMTGMLAATYGAYLWSDRILRLEM